MKSSHIPLNINRAILVYFLGVSSLDFGFKPVAFLSFLNEHLSPVEGTLDPEQYLSKLALVDKNSMLRQTQRWQRFELNRNKIH